MDEGPTRWTPLTAPGRPLTNSRTCAGPNPLTDRCGRAGNPRCAGPRSESGGILGRF